MQCKRCNGTGERPAGWAVIERKWREGGYAPSGAVSGDDKKEEP